MRFRQIIFISFLFLSYSQLLKTTWTINSTQNTTSTLSEKGMTIEKGLCSWRLKQLNQNIQIELYQDNQYNHFMFMTVYLNYSINKVFPYYNGTAHVQYNKDQKYIADSLKKKAQFAEVMFNSTNLVIEHNNSTMVIQLHQQNISPYLYPIALIHAVAKVGLLWFLIQNFRRDNTKLSFSLVYTIIGWELQAHLAVIKLFQSSVNQGDAYFGIMVGLLGWGFTLTCLFFMPRPDIGWQQCQGLGIYFYACSNGFLFTQELNIFLYSISPLLQIRYNSLKNIKNSMCLQAFLIYYLNIFFLLYIKGCPACFLRYPLNYKLCILIVLVSILMTLLLRYQFVKGPYLCLREVVNGKDFNYFQEITLSEGEQILDDVCPICLQPLGQQTLVQNVKVIQNGRKVGRIMKTPCGHRYHPICMRKWLLQKNTCPLDNRQIPPLYE